jgi:hypothetical protein
MTLAIMLGALFGGLLTFAAVTYAHGWVLGFLVAPVGGSIAAVLAAYLVAGTARNGR